MSRPRTDKRKEFLTDILTTAVEGGINYWARVVKYKWDPDGGTALGEAYVDIYETEEAYDKKPEDIEIHHVDIDVIAKGIGVLRAKHAHYPPKAFWEANSSNGEEGDYDAGDADAILQAGIFGEVVYG